MRVYLQLAAPAKALGERHFCRIAKTDNKVESWKEWRTHFLTAVGESSPATAKVMEKAEMSDNVVTPDKVVVSSPDYQLALDLQHVLHARLVSLTTGVSFTIVESSNGEGIEAWRLLSQKHNPRTHSRWSNLSLGSPTTRSQGWTMCLPAWGSPG